MKLIDGVNEKVRKRTAQRCRERGIRIPTFAQMKDPSSLPDDILERLPAVSMEEVDPINLFRITWKNDPDTGLFHDKNFIEFPRELTGVDARIVGLVGKRFPTGAHKVGAGFGCLVPRLVSGGFDPTTQRAVWPSTGNFCRGGAFDCALLSCTAVAILPEGMSRERFEWLEGIGSEVIRTPGTESNVKEIFDKCSEIRKSRPDDVIFNQFEEFGNSLWHYHVTGTFVEEVFRSVASKGDRLSGWISATGSAGTIAAGDYLKKISPGLKITAAEALQCPTLLRTGFGEHGIEGIGDKHVPWIHNVRNTDFIAAVDDRRCLSLLRLFNEPAGVKFLKGEANLPAAWEKNLPLLGISGICNLVAAIKTARHFEMDEHDVLLLPLTDSVDLYRSRLDELKGARGELTLLDAARTYGRHVEAIATDNVKELTFADRKQIHNLKYFTWVEQQGRSSADLNRLWDPRFWDDIYAQVEELDEAITAFNADIDRA